MATKYDFLELESGKDKGSCGVFTAALFYYYSIKNFDLDVYLNTCNELDARSIVNLLFHEASVISNGLADDFGDFFVTFASKFGLLKKLSFRSSRFPDFLRASLPALLELLSIETDGFLKFSCHTQVTTPERLQKLKEDKALLLTLHLTGQTHGCGLRWIISMVGAVARSVYHTEVTFKVWTAAEMLGACTTYLRNSMSEEYEAWDVILHAKDDDSSEVDRRVQVSSVVDEKAPQATEEGTSYSTIITPMHSTKTHSLSRAKALYKNGREALIMMDDAWDVICPYCEACL
ncbi:hypothetical protein CEUSTIGMA_g4243.t1 [Chlamydomonas eustigma]|uniref:Uncharacterized protein n=1 Tax=Chlamydomonas eustigma TaxID=1157962 RepID=A0A250X140_9CHLO|nr:hypothetical protein CEUSTIGMA_g4243.t1 [Chlamydomonas eustigma]|eukprot:GAX76797.1 hypothetical protein CEUSTIGMA_g4243.t1 [Chlamydomonas eustigma]